MYVCTRARVVVLVLCLLTGAAGTADGTPADQSTGAQSLDEKLAAIDAKLEELEKQQTELEALRKDVEELKNGASGAPAPPPGGEKEKKTFDYKGYAQIQVDADRTRGVNPQFQARRIFNAFLVNIGNSTTGKIVVNTTPTNIGLIDGWMETRHGDWAVRAGQVPVPFGCEVSESSSVRTPLEYARSLVSMFPGAYDIGVMAYTNPGDNHGTRLTAALMSGNGPNRADNNAQKDVVVEIRQHFGKGSAYVAADWGTYTTSPAAPGAPQTFPRRYYGAGARYNGDHLKLQAEVHGGRGHAVLANSTRFFGACGQVAYRVGKGTVFTRYEYFDRDLNAANDVWSGPVIGYSHQFNPRNKLVAEVDLFRNPAPATRLGLRWQTSW